MLSQLVGFGGNYCPVRKGLTDDQIMNIAFRINNSDRFDFGENSHAVLRGTETIVGYVGNDSVDLCWPQGQDARKYKIPHSHLKRIFLSV